MNSSSSRVPVQTAAGLASMSLTGQAIGGQDAVTVYTPGTGNIWAVGQDSVLNLEQGWNTAEFNIFGDGNRTQAVFNPGSTIIVRTSIGNGTTNPPICVSNGFTGETNSLTLLPPCSPSGGALQAIQFSESNVTPSFKTLYSFCAQVGCSDGANPYAAPIQATNGNLYGTTGNGGAYLGGTVFRITPSGTLTTLYSFGSQSADGGDPQAGLVQATDGNFYGTAGAGGAYGGGTVFRITPSGTLTNLYSFCSQSGCPDGDSPVAALIQATDGNLYGTTDGYTLGYGTVFKITLSGSLTTLHSFCTLSACPEGGAPIGGVVQATDGNLYGTTSERGAHSSGTVFKITTSGVLTLLYAFCTDSQCADGSTPRAGLVQATDGNLYGTTYAGGATGFGTVFRITPSGTLTTLYSFCSQASCTDGANPIAGLIQATDGNLYGTTSAGGVVGNGTIFKISTSGALATLWNFCSLSLCTDGTNPYAGLVQDTNGAFYGAAYLGGSYNEGMVFSLSAGLGPFVSTLPTSGKVGTVV